MSVARPTSVDAREYASRELQNHVEQFEQHFSKVHTQLVGYTRRSGKMRDNGDVIAQTLRDYGDIVKYNESTKSCFFTLARLLSAIEDHRNTEVERLAERVVKPLAELGSGGQSIKTHIRANERAYKKYCTEAKKLNAARASVSAEKIQQAEVAFNRANSRYTATEKLFRSNLQSFELEKLRSMKKILGDFIRVEMNWHIRALELYSHAHNTIDSIDYRTDLTNFCEALNLFPLTDSVKEHLDSVVLRRSKSHSHLQSGSIYDNFAFGNQSLPIPNRVLSSRSHSGSVDERTSFNDHDPTPVPRQKKAPFPKSQTGNGEMDEEVFPREMLTSRG